MPPLYRRARLSYLLVVVSLLKSATCHPNKFDICKSRIDDILNGIESGIDNETIAQYNYTGPVRGMNKEYEQESRSSFLTITTEGCRVICEDPIDWYWASDISLTLNIVSNWIIPIIALLATLPYDSFHNRKMSDPWRKGKVLKTLGALLNWIGSPQTALTATLFNVHQMRKCWHKTLPSAKAQHSGYDTDTLRKDAYYVLCCLGQFKLHNANDKNGRFIKTLIYGLFDPVCNQNESRDNQTTPQQKATGWNKELLTEMAFQLRMLRRRAVYPTLVSMLLFFIAYAVSLVLAFADIGERTTAHSIAFGILISWLPLLVLFAILDRNPISADRSRKLMSRWMWNVEAVKQWVDKPGLQEPPHWWSQRRQAQEDDAQRPSFDDYISEFVGQGRQIGYNGLPHAVLRIIDENSHNKKPLHPLKIIQGGKQGVNLHLNGRRPKSWWLLSAISLGLVWLEIGMAVMVSYNVPTVGLGCISGSYFVYGCFSSLPWLIHLLPWCHGPKTKTKAVCHFFCNFFCLLSTLTLCFITFAAFSGILKNCLCRGGVSGYIDFENAQFYKQHFNVAKWWRAAAIVGALPVILGLLTTLLLLRDLKTLWQTSEEANTHSEDCGMDLRWLT